jgi:NADH-quinone oxidoreductase subunit N
VALTFVVLILCKSVVHDFSSSIVSEFLIVILIAVFFMLMLLSANDLFFCYLALEGMSFSLYILASSVYRNRLSIEAAVKYFILGSVSSSILAYGISLFLIIVNTLDFFWIKLYFVHISGANGVTSASIGFVVSCILVSFLFKLSAFPCHMWAADIYEGVWTPVTSFFAIVVKMVVFVFTLRLFCYVFSTVDVWQPIFLFSGLGSIAIGSLGAVIQRRVKRFLAFTSVNQVGFLLLGLSTNTVLGVTSSILFLFVYLVMNIVFFGLILNIKHFTQRFQVVYLTDMYAAQSDRFSISGLWVLTLFSMAGIPPLAGFFTKYFILLNLIDSSIYVASIFVLVFSTLSSFYYVSFIKYILFDKKKLVNTFYLDLKTTPETGIILSISSLFILGFIFIPNKVYKLAALLGFTCKYILQ